jgi:Bacterial Ig domain
MHTFRNTLKTNHRTCRFGLNLIELLAAISMGAAVIADTVPMPPVPTDLPSVDLLATDPTALLGTSTASFTLLRSGEPAADLLVSISIAGSASNGVDYVKIPDLIKIPKDALAVDIPIQPIEDMVRRGNKTVLLTVLSNNTYQISVHKKATVTIVDDLYNDLPPKVLLIAPTNGSIFATPGIITLQAQASDKDDVVDRVSFFADDLLLGRITNGINGQFDLAWTNPIPGKYSLFARAVDSFGKATLSDPIEISVTNVPPTLKLLSPANGTSYSSPTNVDIKVEFTDAKGINAKVHIYGDGHFVGAITDSPGTVTWTNVPYGKHLIFARLKDDLSQNTTASCSINIVNIPPAVSITSPASGANFSAPAAITLKANASDIGDTIKTVSFWSNNRQIGNAKLADNVYTLDWPNVKAGFYTVYALATDSHGAKTKSAAIHISVSR